MDCVLIAEVLTWTSPAWWWAIAQVCIGLGLVIFVHELGHFLVAKACGVKCEKFYLGFDFFDIKIGDLVLIPRSLVKFQWGETEYGVGILPLGGYVKMLGQDDNPGNLEQEIERSKAAGIESENEPADNLGVLDRDKMDPRSFLAKTVPQRMAIISAGVIFNLIFAVLFGAIAFKSGVDYSPPVVGDVTPGGPAWENNLYGAHFTQIGDSKVEGYYRFVDLVQEFVLSGGDEPIEVQYSLPGSSDVKTASVKPRIGMRAGVDFALIGAGPALAPKLSGELDVLLKGNTAAVAEPPFQKNDLIVAMAGQPVDDIFDLRRIIAENFDQPMEFVVQRKNENDDETKKVTIQVQPNPLRTSGLLMKWGPVAAIQKDSPASVAGIQKGDEILEINGQPRGDLFTLEQRMTKIAKLESYGDDIDESKSELDSSQRAVTLTVQRSGKPLDIQVFPRMPDFFTNLDPSQPIAINSLGIAIEASRTVEHADVDGVLPGDEITHIEFVLDDPEDKATFEKIAKNHSVDLVETETSLVTLQQLVQMLPAGFNFKLKAKRGEQSVDAEGVTRSSSEFFIHTRGVSLSPLQENYQSQSWQDAFRLGAVQTYWDAKRVFQFLGKLVGGKISPKNLGGPGLIAAAATSEATQGTSRLLLFLVLLSANLAIVNFLPIPVLDGGHMLFLAYEGLFRQPPNEQVQIILTYAGLFMILGLMLFVILMDVQRFSGLF